MASRSSTVGFWLVVAGAGAIAALEPARAQAPDEYSGMCDASAAAAVGPDLFLAASDEDNLLRLYRRGQSQPLEAFDLNAFLKPEDDQETDIEGAAAILGPDPRTGRIYWITSHARNSEGNRRERRHRLFATEFAEQSGDETVTPVGAPYVDLLADLLASPQLKGLPLAEASRLPPEKENGLSIEGLAATEGGGLLVGFRNPRPGGAALAIPLDNPSEVVAGGKPQLGEPVLLDLGGLGVRSMERVGESYWIVAGSYDDAGAFALHAWSGIAGDAPQLREGVDFAGLQPEALFAFPGEATLRVLSDDGKRKIDGKKCRDRTKAEEYFRSLDIAP